MRCKGQIPGSGKERILSRLDRGNSHRRVLREARVENGLSLRTRREFLKPRDPAVSCGNDGQEEEQIA
jgi:hypothetical protein